MISIVISSRNPELLKQITQNIDETIGVPYEIIKIENSRGEKGICKAYNEGAVKSKYDILCFMHEDILFHTTNWGGIVTEILADSSIGLLGVAGGALKTKAPSGWWCAGYMSGRINLLQHYKDGRVVHHSSQSKTETLVDVVTIDGVWFCCRKKVWQECPFDEQTYKGFHFYDVDFALQVFQQYRVCVTYQVLIEHFSEGSYQQDWATTAILFTNKWDSKLPLTVLSLPINKIREIEWKDYQFFAETLLRIGYDKKVASRYVFKCLQYNFFATSNWKLIRELLLS